MKRTMLLVFILLVIGILAAGCKQATATPAAPTTPPTSPPPTDKPPEPTEVVITGSESAGGLLYDKWWKAAGVDEPSGDQALWATQETNTRDGADTWRCKECHGWDYQGADGAYGSGSHFTGFPGVLGTVGTLSSAELLAALEQMNYESPTEVQEKIIPSIIEGKNVVARSKTGTGKTAAEMRQRIGHELSRKQLLGRAETPLLLWIGNFHSIFSSGTTSPCR